MQIEVITVSPFQQNARILICPETKKAVIVDPGDEAQRIMDRVKELEVDIQYILATHGHIDHIGAAAQIQKEWDLSFFMHKADQFLLDSLPLQCVQFGIPPLSPPNVTRYIEIGEIFEVGNLKGKVLFVPGHSPGSVGFLFGNDLIGGDALFAGSIGRTDLPGGSFTVLERSIQEELYTLADEVVVHSGHGPNTTIGQEKAHNPFVRPKT